MQVAKTDGPTWTRTRGKRVMSQSPLVGRPDRIFVSWCRLLCVRAIQFSLGDRYFERNFKGHYVTPSSVTPPRTLKPSATEEGVTSRQDQK